MIRAEPWVLHLGRSNHQVGRQSVPRIEPKKSKPVVRSGGGVGGSSEVDRTSSLRAPNFAFATTFPHCRFNAQPLQSWELRVRV